MRNEEFEQLYEQHAQKLFGFLAYRTGDRILAEDLLADTFERALRARRRFDRERGSAQTWLYAIALNLLRDHGRRRLAETRAFERVSAGTESHWPFEGIDAQHDVTRALNSLTDLQREAIALRYGGDLTVPEIAKLKRERLTTIEGRVYRALEKLRREFASR